MTKKTKHWMQNINKFLRVLSAIDNIWSVSSKNFGFKMDTLNQKGRFFQKVQSPDTQCSKNQRQYGYYFWNHHKKYCLTVKVMQRPKVLSLRLCTSFFVDSGQLGEQVLKQILRKS